MDAVQTLEIYLSSNTLNNLEVMTIYLSACICSSHADYLHKLHVCFSKQLLSYRICEHLHSDKYLEWQQRRKH